MKMIASRILAFTLIALGTAAASATEIPLYETGPAEDAAFIRFVNGSNLPLKVLGAQKRNQLALSPQQPVSDYLTVSANRALKGGFVQGTRQTPSETIVQPGEFVSVIALPDPIEGLSITTMREKPEEFNALKSSLALYNLSSACPSASLKVAGRDVEIFSKVAVNTASPRRMINPVELTVQLHCDDTPVGEPTSLGALAAAERYTIFLLPAADHEGTRIYPATDTVAF